MILIQGEILPGLGGDQDEWDCPLETQESTTSV